MKYYNKSAGRLWLDPYFSKNTASHALEKIMGKFWEKSVFFSKFDFYLTNFWEKCRFYATFPHDFSSVEQAQDLRHDGISWWKSREIPPPKPIKSLHKSCPRPGFTSPMRAHWQTSWEKDGFFHENISVKMG